MGRGGHANSGPAPDPNALRRDRPSDQSEWTNLPAAGRDGPPPSWPLADVIGNELEVWAREWARPQAVMWERFRLPLGATLCISALLIGTWVARIFAYHYWNYFPINMVLPATMLPSALVLDAILMLSNSLSFTAIFGASAFALLFFPSNWPIFAMFHVPVEYGHAQLTVADLFGFQYIRAGMPEYLRIIERGTLRTYGQYAAPLAAFCSALLCSLMYVIWWYLGKWFATVRFLKKI